MPLVLIEIGSQQTPEYEIALINSIHTALLEILKVTHNAVNIRLIVHATHRFLVPINCDPSRYVIINIDCFTGRTLVAKRSLYKTIVEKLNLLNIPKDHVKIVIRESKPENWGILGGFAGCDIDVGYKIEV